MKRLAYSTLWGSPEVRADENTQPFANNEEAKKARDEMYRKLKKQGAMVRRSINKGQLRQYWGFGIPCGRMCDVYEIYFD